MTASQKVVLCVDVPEKIAALLRVLTYKVLECSCSEVSTNPALSRVAVVVFCVDNVANIIRSVTEIKRSGFDGFILGLGDESNELVHGEFLVAGGDRMIRSSASATLISASIDALLRRDPRHTKATRSNGTHSEISQSVMKCAGERIVLHTDTYRCEVNGAAVRLPSTLFNLLALLASRPTVLHSRSMILEHFEKDTLNDRLVDNYIRHIRRLTFPGAIETVYGRGYRVPA